jgi:hypothetical protein
MLGPATRASRVSPPRAMASVRFRSRVMALVISGAIPARQLANPSKSLGSFAGTVLSLPRDYPDQLRVESGEIEPGGCRCPVEMSA